MKIGICGFPQSGKSTLFEALSGLPPLALGKRSEERIGSVKVQDARIDKLAAQFASRKSVYAEMQFVDPPSAAESHAKSLERTALERLQALEVLVPVVRDFAHPLHDTPADALSEARQFLVELVLHDMQPVESRLQRLRKEGAKGREVTTLERVLAHLEEGEPLQKLRLDEAEHSVLQGFGLLSGKPLLFLLNQAEEQFDGQLPQTWQDACAAEGWQAMPISGSIEQEIAQLPPEDQGPFLADLGLTHSAKARFIAKAYAMLQLISFLTTGEDESRAWPIRRGTSALGAAGKIHSDIARGFIRAEVVSCEHLLESGSWKQVKANGQWRLEGKNYSVQDGDVINFRFHI